MANSNVQAVAFANNYARAGANNVVSCYLTMKRVLQVWTGQDVVAVLPNDSNLLVDGSAQDGRPPITDAQVNILIANMTTLVASFEASSSLILNQCLQVSNSANSVVS